MTALAHPQECLQCGLCVTVCPVEMVGGHAIVTFMADPTATDFSVWLCTSCWRCQESCPGGIDIYGLMMAWRRQESDAAPEGYRVAFEHILAHGQAMAVSQEELDQMRAAWGLEPVRLPPPDVARRLLTPSPAVR
ncbi:MAG TPA: 4Fe-4S dicluster domain-containing protein [Anaerolineae bacterium]|nr:4Fe-4S dicluster domain-containing protein [Anaerolineae bacterium]